MSALTTVALCCVAALACQGSNLRSPAEPVAVLPPSGSGPASGAWIADSTLVEVNSALCHIPGGAAGVRWSTEQSGSTLTFVENATSDPIDRTRFSGSLVELEFSASGPTPAGRPTNECDFQGGGLSGSFSADWSRFEADETMTWGSPAGQIRVVYHVIATRL
jgi:hypothetical protein